MVGCALSHADTHAVQVVHGFWPGIAAAIVKHNNLAYNIIRTGEANVFTPFRSDGIIGCYEIAGTAVQQVYRIVVLPDYDDFKCEVVLAGKCGSQFIFEAPLYAAVKKVGI